MGGNFDERNNLFNWRFFSVSKILVVIRRGKENKAIDFLRHSLGKFDSEKAAKRRAKDIKAFKIEFFDKALKIIGKKI